MCNYFQLGDPQILISPLGLSFELYTVLHSTSGKTWQTEIGFRRMGRTPGASFVVERIARVDCQWSTNILWKEAEAKGFPPGSLWDSYLVDPASSHILVPKIKPCMSKCKHSYCETAGGTLNQLSLIWLYQYYLDNRSNSRANTCEKFRLLERMHLLDLSNY